MVTTARAQLKARSLVDGSLLDIVQVFPMACGFCSDGLCSFALLLIGRIIGWLAPVFCLEGVFQPVCRLGSETVSLFCVNEIIVVKSGIFGRHLHGWFGVRYFFLGSYGSGQLYSISSLWGVTYEGM